LGASGFARAGARARLLADASKPPSAALPAPAERAFADAGTLLAGAANVETIERAVKLLESTLSAAPGHSGALRACARSQRMLALLGRDPASARDRRSGARCAAPRCHGRSAFGKRVAADVAHHLFWGEWECGAGGAMVRAGAARGAPDAEIPARFRLVCAGRRPHRRCDGGDERRAGDRAHERALHSDLGWFYFRTGRYDDALCQCRFALEMSARDASAQTCRNAPF
jgi:hypothetical protein